MQKRKGRRVEQLRDFTTTVEVIPISLLAIIIGFIATIAAYVLLRLIGLVTNLFYYQRFDWALSSPAGNHLGVFSIAIPVIGALIVGIMARYGSEKIRGHGIPEAIESILMNGSRVAPKLAALKPISAAISIGSGGPFGAEGPIIMTGGAFGSLIAQFFHLTSAERKTLLVAGAAAGMAAVFATPLAAVLLAVELLLFEWKPRSIIPVALASATAGAVRPWILGHGPLFPVPPHTAFIGPGVLAGCVFAGFGAGLLAYVLTNGVYAAEDAFHKLPVHWMWWPAIGAVFVGIGGLIFPQALGVGYDVIGRLLQGNVPLKMLGGVLLIKSLVWIIALGSGTSGGVVAPVLMTGAALGGLESLFLPHAGAGFWELTSMGAMLAATMSCPFTGVVFAIELTHDLDILLPLVVTCFLAYALNVLALKRSILTEKIARRGYHLTREYATDPLEILFVREVMVPVGSDHEPAPSVSVNGTPVVAFTNEPLRAVVYRMAETGVRTMPVLHAEHWDQVVGTVSLEGLLHARSRNLHEERSRERVFRVGRSHPNVSVSAEDPEARMESVVATGSDDVR